MNEPTKAIIFLVTLFFYYPPACAEIRAKLSGKAWIIDGDTLSIAKISVRLNGLHCPELIERYGFKAGLAAEKLARNKTVLCELNGVKTYNRWVGRCYVDGIDIAESLIENGFCARCPRYDPFQIYVKAQKISGDWEYSLPKYCNSSSAQ